MEQSQAETMEGKRVYIKPLELKSKKSKTLNGVKDMTPQTASPSSIQPKRSLLASRQEALKKARRIRLEKIANRKSMVKKQVQQEIADKSIKPNSDRGPVDINPSLLEKLGKMESMIEKLSIRMEEFKGGKTELPKSRVEDRQASVVKTVPSFEQQRGGGTVKKVKTVADQVNTFTW